MSFWWLQPGWTSTTCAACSTRIWPEGDPDWGYCYDCFTERLTPSPQPEYQCDICHRYPAVTGTNGYGVCSEACHDEALARVHPDNTTEGT